MTINTDILTILQNLHYDGCQVQITAQLDRATYTNVNKVLEACGGKWNRKAKAHIFPSDASELLGDVIANGEYIDPKKQFQFFETPSAVTAQLLNAAGIKPGDKVLEPSAGKGALAIAAKSAGAKVECIELNPEMVTELAKQGFTVSHGDFLERTPKPTFDCVLMNPPFAKSADIAHVRHAFDFLKPGGRLVSVMATGWTFRQDRKAKEFRQWLGDANGQVTSLPEGAFKSSGTMVNTVIVAITKSVA